MSRAFILTGVVAIGSIAVLLIVGVHLDPASPEVSTKKLCSALLAVTWDPILDHRLGKFKRSEHDLQINRNQKDKTVAWSRIG